MLGLLHNVCVAHFELRRWENRATRLLWTTAVKRHAIARVRRTMACQVRVQVQIAARWHAKCKCELQSDGMPFLGIGVPKYMSSQSLYRSSSVVSAARCVRALVCISRAPRWHAKCKCRCHGMPSASAMACQVHVPWHAKCRCTCHGMPSASARASAMACQVQVPWQANCKCNGKCHGMPTASARASAMAGQVQVQWQVPWHANCKCKG